MAAKKRKSKRSPVRFGRNADEVYATAERILALRNWFTDPIGLSPSLEPEILAARARFEARLAADPRRAILEYEEWARSPWRGSGGKSLRDERLAQAVIGITDAFVPGPHAGIYGDMAINALRELGVQASRQQLIKLAQSGAVVKARKEGAEFSNGGLQAAAIAMVSILTSVGVQTVKRALLTWRRRKRSTLATR